MTNLEEEKIKLEIKELNRHWFKKPQYLQVLLPTTLAIFSLLYAITSGLFSSKQELLELNKKRLETDILSFQMEKTKLTNTNNELKNAIKLYNDSLQDRNLLLRKFENSFTKEKSKILALNDELSILKQTKEDYNTKISQLANEYNSKKQVYLKELESKYYSEIDYTKKIKELQTTINNQSSRIEDLNYYISILKTNPFIKTGKQFDFSMWYHEKAIEYHTAQGKKGDDEVKRLEIDIERLKKEEDSIKVRYKIERMK